MTEPRLGQAAPVVERTLVAGGSKQRTREPELRRPRKAREPDLRQPDLSGFADALDAAAQAAMMKPVAQAYAVDQGVDHAPGRSDIGLGFAA